MNLSILFSILFFKTLKIDSPSCPSLFGVGAIKYRFLTSGILPEY